MGEKVKDYMILDVEYLLETASIGEAIERLIRSRRAGMPVVSDGMKLVGFVSAKELLKSANFKDQELGKIIKQGTYVGLPEMDLDDVARIMFRYGLRDLPIVDENSTLVGILSNLDIVRSHFERATPMKAETLKALLSQRYGVSFSLRRETVSIDTLKPTQWKVFEDELEGRRYELERGFAEPILILRKGVDNILVDGHHRALAAMEMGLKRLSAFVLLSDHPEEFDKVEIGLERVAREHHLSSLADIEVDHRSHHPLLEVTQQLIRRFEGRGDLENGA
jgi:IMP dehydrogenase